MQKQSYIYNSQTIEGTVTSPVTMKVTKTDKEAYFFKLTGTITGRGEGGDTIILPVEDMIVMAFDDAAVKAAKLGTGDLVSLVGNLIHKRGYKQPAFSAGFTCA